MPQPDHQDLPGLVEAVRAGRVDTVEPLAAALARLALADARRRLADRWLAEDAAQEAVVEALACLPRLRDPHAVAPWLRTIVRKHADRLTRRRREHPVDDPQPAAADDDPAIAALLRRETVGQVRAALAGLSPADRTALTLRYAAEWSYEEMAAALSVPRSTVKKRLHDARRRLRRALDAEPVAGGGSDCRADTAVADRVAMVVAVRCGDLARAAALLARAPALAVTREDRVEVDLAGRRSGGRRGFTVLHRAAQAGQAPLTRLLLDHGAVSTPADDGVTPLHEAALVGAADVAALLLARGADPDAPTHRGQTPAHWAALRGHDDVVASLADAGADLARTDAGDRTPGDWTARAAARSPAPASPPPRSDPPTPLERPAASDRLAHRHRPPIAEDGGPAMTAPVTPPALLRTDLKAVDVLAPLPAGGLAEVAGPSGVGQLVLACEVTHTVVARGGAAVAVGVAGRAFGAAADLRAGLVDAGLAEGTRLVTVDGLDEAAEGLRGAAEAAADLAAGHDEVVVLVDGSLARAGGVAAMAACVAAGGATPVTVLAVTELDEHPGPLEGTDARLVLSETAAARGWYPAVDVAASWSRVAQPPEVAAVAERVRGQAARTERVQRYLTQPFAVAAHHTARPAAPVPCEAAAADLTAVLDDAADVDDDALLYTGRLPARP